MSRVVLGLILGAILGFGTGYLAGDATPKCARDHHDSLVCVITLPEGPNQLEVSP